VPIRPLAGRLPGLLAAALSAVLLFLAGEPAGLGALAWVALVPLFAAVLAGGTARRGSLLGLTFGLVYFGLHLAWIFLFGWMAWTALTIFLSLYVSLGMLVAGAVAGAPTGALGRTRFAPLLVAGAWTGAELLRERWPYGGYSWGAVGTTQAGVPVVRWLAGVVGVYGLSFLLAFVAAVIAQLIVRREVSWASIGIVGAALLACIAADVGVYGRPSRGEPLRVAVVQGGVPRPVVSGQRDVILRNHVDATRALLAGREVDVVVWPEESVGEGAVEGLAVVQDLAREVDTPFLVGQTLVDESGAFRNVVRYIDATGVVRGTYEKRHPVPFGEYVPVGFLRRFVGTLRDQIPTDQQPGHTPDVFDVARGSGGVPRGDGTRVATPICFESVFPRDILDFARAGAELFVLETNDSSFERTYASQQHLAHTRMRALETRQWFVQAALSGISAVIEPDGMMTHTTRLFTTDAFVADVRTRTAQSLYAKTGDVFAEAFAVAAAVAFIAGLRRRRRPDPRAPDDVEILAA
jgi:apolipoprotein N-acyltransferase